MVKDRIAMGSLSKAHSGDIHAFFYGIDEWFVNMHMLPAIMERVPKINIIYIGDNLKTYPKNMIDWKRSSKKNTNEFLKDVLGDAYNPQDNRNIDKLAWMINPNAIKTIKDLEKQRGKLKLFHSKFKEYYYASKISVPDESWVHNLDKHLESDYILYFAMYHPWELTDNDQKVFDYVLERIKPVVLLT